MQAIIVDDEPDGVRALQKMLEMHCPQVQVVATCANAEHATAARQQGSSAGCVPRANL